MTIITFDDRFAGCLLGGALGDAAGADVEFDSQDRINATYGPAGITAHHIEAQARLIATDDTQMTLFTLDGLRYCTPPNGHDGMSSIAASVWIAYLAWLDTQGETWRPSPATPTVSKVRSRHPLAAEQLLWHRRAPGMTCVSALRSGSMGTLAAPPNNSSGCGAVMRAAPAGLLARRLQVDAFDLGVATGVISHGRPDGYLPAGALAEIIALVCDGADIDAAIGAAHQRVAATEPRSRTAVLLTRAIELAASTDPITPELLNTLGNGWTGDEALAIAALVALRAPTFVDGVITAINHDGDSDSTGSIVGNILGAHLGTAALPPSWLAKLDLTPVIETCIEMVR